MAKTLEQAINELSAEISELEAGIRKKKESVNTLCEIDGRAPLYVVADSDTALPTQIRSDQFYGQPLASAVRTILEMRKQQNLGAATNNEIYDSLITGGFQFQTKSEDVARASLRNSLSKNTTTFHKLPNSRFGLLSWYPNAKPAKAAGGGAAEDLGDFEEESSETEKTPPAKDGVLS